jgi:hypothetical protein
MEPEPESADGNTMASRVESVDRKITLLIGLWLLDKLIMVILLLMFG